MLGIGKHVPKEHLVEARVHTEQTRNAVRLWIENSSGDYLALYIIGHKQPTGGSISPGYSAANPFHSCIQ